MAHLADLDRKGSVIVMPLMPFIRHVVLLSVIFLSGGYTAASGLGPTSLENFTVSIGAIFNVMSNEEILSAFNYEAFNTFRSMSRVRLHPVIASMQVDDSYSVSTAWCKLMHTGVFSIFGSHTLSTLNTVRSFSSTFHIPYVTTGPAAVVQPKRHSSRSSPAHDDGDHGNDQLGFEIFMRPMYSRAIAELVLHYDCREIFYVYNSNEGLERLQQLLEALAVDGHVIRTNVYRVNDANDAFRTLRQLDLRSRDDKKILLDMSTKETERLLQKVNNDTSGVHHRYILVDLGIEEMSLPAFHNGGMNVTGLRLVDIHNNSVRSYLRSWSLRRTTRALSGGGNHVNYQCKFEVALAIDAATALRHALSKMAAQHPEFFRRMTHDGKVNGSESIECDSEQVKPWKIGKEVVKHIRDIEFFGLSGVVKFDKFGHRRDYTLDVLEVSLSGSLAKIAVWHSERGLTNQQLPIRIDKGSAKISNKTRQITSILAPPYLMLGSSSSSSYDGYCSDLAKKIAIAVGFEFTIVPVKDGKYGAMDENGTWNGMVGELIRKEADLAIAPLTITAAREKVIDFSKPFMSLGISIMIKKPEKDTPGVVSFMKPLSYEIWMCVVFAYIGVSVVLFLVSRFSPLEWNIEDDTDGPSVTNNFTIFNSLWFSLGAFMQQGCDIEPRSMSGRIVGSVWWFFTLIIISSYTANLAAFLTVERMHSPIESADDLAKQTEIKYGSVDSGSTRDFFRTSSIPVYERMWAFMSSTEPSVFVKTFDDGVRQVREKNGKYAFLAESSSIDYINQRYPCDTMKVGSNLDSKGFGVGIPLGSDLRDRITLAVLELLESGELAKLETKWWLDKGQCGKEGSPKKQESTSSLKLPNVAGIFYILIAGLLLSIVTALIEFLYKTKLDARKRKTSYGKALRSKAKLSISGEPDRQSTELVSTSERPGASSDVITPYTYSPAVARLISTDGTGDIESHTQV